MRQPLIDPLLKGHDALGSLLGLERGDDEVPVLHPDPGVAAQQGVDPSQELLQLGLTLLQYGRVPSGA